MKMFFVLFCHLLRQMKLAQLKQMQVKEDSCTLCVDSTACVTLMPCEHKSVYHSSIINIIFHIIQFQRVIFCHHMGQYIDSQFKVQLQY